jgi:hypothetical protein
VVLLDVMRGEAEAGQRARGRTIAPGEMARQAARWRRLMARGPAREGWESVAVLDRERAARTSAFDFPAAAEQLLAPATM